jgi:hypothetical protein
MRDHILHKIYVTFVSTPFSLTLMIYDERFSIILTLNFDPSFDKYEFNI